jgi:Mrp family chromosome partitioning ATPase
MGRMLETLNQAAIRPEASAPVLPKPTIPEVKLAPPPEDESIPYIEVGGSGRVDASPQVLACPLPTRLPRPKPAVAAKPVEVAPQAKTVEFRPAGRPSRPAPPPPTRRMAPELVAYHRPDDPVSGEYQTILTDLLGHLPTGRPLVILFTAITPWAGTTTVLLNLAVTAARQSRRTVVVDGNSRRPSVADRLGLDPAPGWRDLAAGTVPPEHSVQDTVQTYLHALTAGHPGAAVDHRVAPAAAAAALAPLREHAELVLIDAASWNEGEDVAALASVCDGVVVVLDSSHVGANGKIDPLPWLRQPPTNLLGCITTRKMTPDAG